MYDVRSKQEKSLRCKVIEEPSFVKFEFDEIYVVDLRCSYTEGEEILLIRLEESRKINLF